MADQAIRELTPVIGTRAACAALGRSRATYYRRHRQSPAPPRPARDRAPHPRALSAAERAEVLGVLHHERFVDQAPASIYANLLDEGRYLCSVPTMYRVLRAADEVRERRRQATHPAAVKPELLATGPNEIWSWDITKLLGPAKWTYFHLYVVIDIFSRYVPGWLLATRETAELAERLLGDTIRKQNVAADGLTIHADRGTSMASKPVGLCCSPTWASPRATPARIAPTTIRTRKRSSRRSSTGRSSLDGSAPSRMPALSASASSAGTTTSTAIPVSASTPRPPSTSATLQTSKSSAPVCFKQPTWLILNGSSVSSQSRQPCRDLPGSTNPWRSRQHSNNHADRSHQG